MLGASRIVPGNSIYASEFFRKEIGYKVIYCFKH